MLRGRDVGEAGAMERGHQEVAGPADAVAGEDAAGSIRAVRRRREAEDEQPRARGSPNRARAAPSTMSSRKARRFSRATRAVVAQPRTAFARNDRVVDGVQRGFVIAAVWPCSASAMPRYNW